MAVTAPAKRMQYELEQRATQGRVSKTSEIHATTCSFTILETQCNAYQVASSDFFNE